MADTTEGRIARALFDHVNAMVLDPVMPVAAPNRSFAKPDDGKYIRVTHIPNVTNRMEISSDGDHQYLGMLQVSIYWPHNRGEVELRDVAGQVISHWPCDLILHEDGVRVRIMKRPEAADLVDEDTGVQVPVTIEYEAYA